MSRYDDRGDYDRGRRNYGRRSRSEYDNSYGQRREGEYGRGFDDERDRYSTESRWRGQYSGRSPYRSGSEYQSSREDYGNEYGLGYGGSEGESSSESEYGSSGLGYGGAERGYTDYRRGYGSERGYGGGRGYIGSERGYGGGRYADMSQRSNYPSGSRSSSERYGERGRGYDYDRGEYGGGEERGWWDRASDAVASWFGDEEAERRRRMDEQRPHRGKGPKSYRRSDERIQEDVNDRLSEGYLDATEINVQVQNGEVTLSGTVNSRIDKRRAEDIAEYVSGVSNVENRLRVKGDASRYGSLQSTGTSDTSTMGTSTSAASGTSGTSTTGTAARGRTAGT